MVAENAVLHDHVVVRLEAPGLPIEFEDGGLAVVLEQLPQPRIATDLRSSPAIDDRGIASGDAALRADGGAGVDLAEVEHHVQCLFDGKPVVCDAYRPRLAETQRPSMAQLLCAPVEPDIVSSLDAVQILQR